MTVKIMVNTLANLLPTQGARSAVYMNLKWAIPEKNPNRRGLRTLEFSAITACQVINPS